MVGRIKLNNLSSSPYLLTFLVSMLPIAELRGGLPLGISLGIPPFKAYLISVIGNVIPVLPILIGLKYLSKIAQRYSWSSKILNILERRIQKKKQIIYRYGIGGIIILVAIPLPITGAWTGSLVSFFLGIPVKYSFPAIFAGVCIAGVIVLFATLGIFGIGKIFSGM